MHPFKLITKILTIMLLALLVVVLVLIAPSLWNHIVRYPALEKETYALHAVRKQPPKPVNLNCYKGVLHVHCYWSHDSEGKLVDIIPAARRANLDFIFFSDHPHADSDSFPRAYYGTEDEIVLVPGTEKRGLLVWPMDSLVVDWRQDLDTIVQRVISKDGLIFYAHTEEPHDWSNPDYQGMEIYNIHTDIEDEYLPRHVVNFLINGDRYRHWCYRELYDFHGPILQLWDSLNTTRRIVGISAVDAHENQNIRARYLDDSRVEWIGPNANALDTTEVGWLENLYLNVPDASGWAFKLMTDTYYHSFNHVSNYILADSLNMLSLSRHLKKGHVYTAFTSLAEADGFLFYATDSSEAVCAVMGDSVALTRAKSIKAQSPLPCRFRLIKNGLEIDCISDSYDYCYTTPLDRGTYRIESDLYIGSQWLQWIYSNPIYIHNR